MKDSLNLIFSSPVANLMIVAGLICLGLAVLGKIEIKEFKLGPSTKSERFFATVIGVALLIVGFRLLPASVETGSIDSPPRPSPESSVSSTKLSTSSPNSAPPQAPKPSISTPRIVQSPEPSPTSVAPKPSPPQAPDPISEPPQVLVPPRSSQLPSANKDLYIRSKLSNKCIHLSADSNEDYGRNGATISQWECLNLDNLKWNLENAGEGYFFIRSKLSNKCIHLSADSNEDYGRNGATISQWECLNLDNLKWGFQ